MPLHDLGYRAWTGDMEPEYQRFWMIAQTGIRLAWRSMWLRRMLLAAWTPAVLAGLGFFFFERFAKEPGDFRAERSLLALGPFAALPNIDLIRSQLVAAQLGHADLESVRHLTWAWLLLTFFRYPQGALLMVIVGLIAPNLISQDLRSRAFLIYFSRPIARWEYVLGKACVVFTFVSLITMLPALSLYLLGVLLSPDLSVIWHTWDLPLRIILASVVLMIPTTALALCFSSLTRESRYASFAWYAVWILGWIAYANLTAQDLGMGAQGMASLDSIGGRWTLLSLFHLFGVVQAWVFGLGAPGHTVLSGFLILGIISVVSYAVLLQRVSAPMKV